MIDALLLPIVVGALLLLARGRYRWSDGSKSDGGGRTDRARRHRAKRKGGRNRPPYHQVREATQYG
jgi:hypothetical protein